MRSRVAITLCLTETEPIALQLYIIVLIIVFKSLLSFIPMFTSNQTGDTLHA
nr:MAG TPA: hypothetical protein [Caudoviricetes sp.]